MRWCIHSVPLLTSVADAGCLRGRGKKNKKGTSMQEVMISHCLHWKGNLEGILSCFVHWKGNLEGILSHFVHWKGNLEVTLSRFVHWKGKPEGNLPCFLQRKGTLKDKFATLWPLTRGMASLASTIGFQSFCATSFFSRCIALPLMTVTWWPILVSSTRLAYRFPHGPQVVISRLFSQLEKHSARSYSVCKQTIDTAARQGATGDSPSASTAGAGIMSAIACAFKKHTQAADRHYISLLEKNYFHAGLSGGHQILKYKIKKQSKKQRDKSRDLLFVFRQSLHRCTERRRT